MSPKGASQHCSTPGRALGARCFPITSRSTCRQECSQTELPFHPHGRGFPPWLAVGSRSLSQLHPRCSRARSKTRFGPQNTAQFGAQHPAGELSSATAAPPAHVAALCWLGSHEGHKPTVTLNKTLKKKKQGKALVGRQRACTEHSRTPDNVTLFICERFDSQTLTCPHDQEISPPFLPSPGLFKQDSSFPAARPQGSCRAGDAWPSFVRFSSIFVSRFPQKCRTARHAETQSAANQLDRVDLVFKHPSTKTIRDGNTPRERTLKP